MTLVHFECSECRKQFPLAASTTWCHDCKRPLLARYDRDRVLQSWAGSLWSNRSAGLWRYRELLPLPMDAEPVSLGESETPLLLAPALSKLLGINQLWIKDESRLPGASFKARGMAVAVSMLHYFGTRRATLPSAGNAAGAAAIYCGRAGIELDVFVPKDTPVANISECLLHGARVHLIDGLISDCAVHAKKLEAESGVFNLATLNHPYRIEGKKTMGLELAEQFGKVAGRNQAELPDVIVYPTGGGTGLIGMAKVFAEWHEIQPETAPRTKSGRKSPRFVSVQSEGCAPLVVAYEKSERFAVPFPNAATKASGLRVPNTIGDRLILDAVRDSGGTAIAGSESDIVHWMKVAGSDGISLCPESAIALSGLDRMIAGGQMSPDESVVVFNTASALKYSEILASMVSETV